MKNVESQHINITPNQFERILTIAASQAAIRDVLMTSHDDSTWWPRHVKDWRTRMLIAGLSARISYRMVPIYREIVDKLDSYSWTVLSHMSEGQIEEIIRRIGLHKTRVRFWKSLVHFIDLLDKRKTDIRSLSNDELITLIQAKVEGASYKLAQCCVLYAKGYYCGVMPVDSGMKDMLGPCLGFPIPPGGYGHEAFRRQLERLTSSIDCRKIAFDLGYGDLEFPDQGVLTWWAHVVLISYKRYFCNNRKPESCAFRNNPNIGLSVGSACSRRSPEYGGTRAILIEGVDGTGKTSLARLICRQGYRLHHFGYNEQRTGHDVKVLYQDLIEAAKNRRIVMDRSFISEEVYGTILRGASRLCNADLRELLELLREFRTFVIYLYTPRSILLQRTAQNPRSSKKDLEILAKILPSLESKYQEVLDLVQHYVPVRRFDTSKVAVHEISTILFQ